MSASADLREFLNFKCDELIRAAGMFRTLLPHPTKDAAIHSGEEGRFAESLLTTFLRDSLPSRLSVATGFVVNLNKKLNSGQTDILVYDSSKFSAYLKYGDAVVVPAESVVAAISVKERLRYSDIGKELEGLANIGAMCGGLSSPSPYLSLFAFDDADMPKDPSKKVETSWKHVRNAYPDRQRGYSANELVDAIVVLNKFYIRKRSWKHVDKDAKMANAKYVWSGASNEHRNIYLQELVHSIHQRICGRDNDFSPKLDTAQFAATGMAALGGITVKCHNRPPD